MLDRMNLRAVLPTSSPANIERFAEPLASACTEFGIDTPARLAAFLAQVAHESGNLSLVVENLNYSAEGLRAIFPRYFADATTALEFARQSQRIANRVYADRMGNGDEASGDGWRFRGRGLIQVTGRANYAACGQALGLDLLASPELLEQPGPAARSAAWYWSSHGLNSYADKGDFDGVCDLINRGRKTAAEGDSIGWVDRKDHYARALSALQPDAASA